MPKRMLTRNRKLGKPKIKFSKRMIIVTEGRKSEVSYFSELRHELGLSTREVKIVPGDSSSPISVALTAEREIGRAGRDEIGAVFCIFDRDTHSTYGEALKAIERLSRDNVSTCDSVEAIPSIPCFEYWYLLHVKNTRQSFGTEGSPCGEVIKILKGFKKFRRYKKASCRGFYKEIKENRGDAVLYARAALKDSVATEDTQFQEDPSTRVYLVVEAMQELAKQIGRVEIT